MRWGLRHTPHRVGGEERQLQRGPHALLRSKGVAVVGVAVVEVNRSNREHRAGSASPGQRGGAARAVLAHTAAGEPKMADGPVKMARVLRALSVVLKAHTKPPFSFERCC